MESFNNRDKSNVSIIEAVEILANIADSEKDDLDTTKNYDIFIEGKKLEYKTVKWIPEDSSISAINVIKDSFRVVFDYLKNVYKKDKNRVDNTDTIEGIKAIMVLVGDAAKKIDKNKELLKQSKIDSITELKEYKLLQEFYQKKIERKVDVSLLGKWVLGLTKLSMPFGSKGETNLLYRVDYKVPFSQSAHVFVDFDAVRKDLEYELFFLRKEDGGRFFNPRLVRNIKLICDFGGPLSQKKADNIFAEAKQWQQQAMNSFAKDILETTQKDIEIFFQKAWRFKNRELVSELNKSLMALMLCRNSDLSKKAGKQCVEYFCDFQRFLRRALTCAEYKKLLAYPPSKENEVAHCLLDLCHSLCSALFLRLRLHKISEPILQKTIAYNTEKQTVDAEDPSNLIQSHLIQSYTNLNQLVKQEQHNSLTDILDLLEEGGMQAFDPIMQHNLPNHWYGLQLGEDRCLHIRMPSVTHQEFINKATIIDEFKGFLRSYKSDSSISKRHLIFNLQDRTSWREHARSVAIEELQKNGDFNGSLVVVTFAVDTDFYYQQSVYNSVNHAQVFLQQFEEQLFEENAGFFFPPALKKIVDSKTISGLLKGIHSIFFSSKNVLSVNQRLDFIQIFYTILQLKILDAVKATSFSFTCKDGIDMGASSSVKLFALLKLLEKEDISQEDINFAELLLHSPALILRKRLMLPDNFQELSRTIKAIESIRNHLGYVDFLKAIDNHLSPFFSQPLSQIRAIIP